MSDKEKSNIAIYSRKSKFTGKGESIENQIELCRQYIKEHFEGAQDKDILIYEDEGFSGGNMERPEFKKMMNDIRKSKISACVCYRLDRISRNTGDFAKLIEELSALNVSFVSIKEQFDTSSPMGRAMMYIASVFSQLERETIAERIKDNLHELSKTGRWLGGTTPTGYISESVENVTIDGKVKKSCQLKLVESEAETVKIIFAKFLETHSLTHTDAYLIQNGILSKNNKLFSRFTIKGILSNPVYMIADRQAYEYLISNNADLFADESDFDGKCGIMAYNRTVQKSGKSHKLRPIDEWIAAVGKHEGLISGKDWVKVQEILYDNKSKSYKRLRNNNALLSGLLFCGSCGSYMRPKLSKRRNMQGELIYSYLCSLKERSCKQACDAKNINGNVLDNAVFNEIKFLPVQTDEFLRHIDNNVKIISAQSSENEKALGRILTNIFENEASINALITALSKSAQAEREFAESYIIKQIQDLHKQNATLKLRESEMKSLINEKELSQAEFNNIQALLLSFSSLTDNMDRDWKRRALKMLIKKAVWNGEDIHVYL